jgi:hypothetical protein
MHIDIAAMHNPTVTQYLTKSQAHNIPDTHRGFPMAPTVVRKVNFSSFHLSMLSRTSQLKLLHHVRHHLPDRIHVVVANTQLVCVVPLTQFRLSVMWYVLISMSRPTSHCIDPSFMEPQAGLMPICHETTLSQMFVLSARSRMLTFLCSPERFAS